MTKLLNDQELTNLKKSLPKGYTEYLADKAKCSRSYIIMVFQNKAKDIYRIEKVINEAIKLKNDVENKIAQLNNKITSNT